MPFNLVPQAYAQPAASTPCEPGSSPNGIDLFDCPADSMNNPIFSRDIYQSLAGLTNHLVRNLFILAGVILFFMIVYAGFKIAQGTKASFEEGKTIAQNALIGFIIMFCSFWVVQLVQYITGAGILVST